MARKSRKKEKPVDSWLTLGTAVIGMGFYLLPKTPLVILVALVLMFLLLVHPIWNFWWIEDRPRRRAGALTCLAVLLGVLGLSVWPDRSAAVVSLSQSSIFPPMAAMGNRPWLFVVVDEINPSTGRIRLVIQNKGGTPAYKIRVEDWGEISRADVEGGEVIPPDRADEFQAQMEKMKFFRKEYDTRVTVGQGYGARSSASVQPMLEPGELFGYEFSDWTDELIKNLKLTGQRHRRFVASITYTDNTGTFTPPPFNPCYEIKTFQIDAKVEKRLLRCPDQDMNTSR